MIDNEIINVFTVSDFEPRDVTNKKVVEYNIENDLLVRWLNPGVELLDEPKSTGLKHSSSLGSIFSDGLSLSNTKSANNMSASTTPLSSTATNSQSLYNIESTNIHSKSNITSSFNDRSKDTTFSQVSTPKSITNDVDLKLKKIDDEFNLRFNALKRSFSEIKSIEVEPKYLFVIPSKFDLDGIYNLIFHNHVSDYEEVFIKYDFST